LNFQGRKTGPDSGAAGHKKGLKMNWKIEISVLEKSVVSSQEYINLKISDFVNTECKLTLFIDTV
jgi:hypothetical protein